MDFAIKVKFSGQEGIMAASGSGQWFAKKVFLYSSTKPNMMGGVFLTLITFHNHMLLFKYPKHTC